MEEYSTSKVIRSVEALLEIGFKLTGVYITYLAFDFFGVFLFKNDFNSVTLFSLLMFPALYVLKTAHVIISPFFVQVRISETEVESRTGILTQRLDKLNLKTVENIEIITTVGGRLFNYSTILLYAHGSWVRLPYVVNPEKIKNQIESNLENVRSK